LTFEPGYQNIFATHSAQDRKRLLLRKGENSMRKRSVTVIIFLVLALMLGTTLSFAADPSGLIVVRASDNSLWKATCDGLTCTEFTSFPGMFGSQPTVYWDENIQRYVLWGRAADGSIWRSTFSRLGVFQNDWTSIAGSTASPPGAAGGGVANTFVGSTQGDSTVNLSDTAVNIRSITGLDAPWDGFVVCYASGDVQHYRVTTGYSYSRLFLTQTSGGTATTMQISEIPPNGPTGYSHFPFAFHRWFSVSAGSNAFYLTGDGSFAAGGSVSVNDAMLSCQYQPYSY
jgi:hypothetical protein